MEIDLHIKVPGQGTSRVHYRVDVPVNGTLQQKCLMKLVMRAHQKLEELRPTGASPLLDEFEGHFGELVYALMYNEAVRAYHAFMKIEPYL